MVLEKKLLSPGDIERQTAIELPDRETLACFPLVLVKIYDIDILTGNTLNVELISLDSVNAAVVVCALAIQLGKQCNVFQNQ